eukprot:CAMPEP_0177663810 /NCGR_PEP_ID=MMETSP0447-20121125/20127_1 /TAXON_ID=0 /ORGANISM="Stygamoeba regulata, Strain BSH-02190019" /LENGTH=205 /DNA_ID=CAMNT_0019169677 /DNA_START=333 /DNA_END=947 /DNA_ORIENTATION=+
MARTHSNLRHSHSNPALMATALLLKYDWVIDWPPRQGSNPCQCVCVSQTFVGSGQTPAAPAARLAPRTPPRPPPPQAIHIELAVPAALKFKYAVTLSCGDPPDYVTCGVECGRGGGDTRMLHKPAKRLSVFCVPVQVACSDSESTQNELSPLSVGALSGRVNIGAFAQHGASEAIQHNIRALQRQCAPYRDAGARSHVLRTHAEE